MRVACYSSQQHAACHAAYCHTAYCDTACHAACHAACYADMCRYFNEIGEFFGGNLPKFPENVQNIHYHSFLFIRLLSVCAVCCVLWRDGGIVFVASRHMTSAGL